MMCADAAIPTLAVVLDPLEARRIVDEVCPADRLPAPDLLIRVLRHHPGKRCVFEAAEKAGERAWIGKVFAADRADIYHMMVRLARGGFGPEAEFSIPAPIAYLPELRLLLQEKVTGASATELFLSPDEGERERISGRCAEWLARLHLRSPLPGPTFDLAQYQASIARWSIRIDAVGAALGDKARHLRARLEHTVSGIGGVSLRTCHGSFTHHQIIAADNRTVTFDWDDHVVADPAFDVARFVVALRRLSLRSLRSIRSLDPAVDVFLRTYRSRQAADVTGNLHFYAAAICLRLAKKDVMHHDAGWTEKADATLTEGLRLLDQGI
jgi:aminoglycoside phosphotransferase (APT) family kinase protein